MRLIGATRPERIQEVMVRGAEAAIQQGLSRLNVDAAALAGEHITVDGRRLLHFGSCCYLGLSQDRRLKDAAIAAIERFGTIYSASPAYSAVSLYRELAERLERLTGLAVVVPATTTLGHLGALPVLISAADAVVVDAQAHASVHLGTQVLASQGVPVETVPHNDLAALEARVAALAPHHHRVWYLADGVYSMAGDVAPFAGLAELLERFVSLHAYIDDAHGCGWAGRPGRGLALEALGGHPRVVVALSFAKSFGSGGAALVFADRATARRVELAASTLTFSGPIHPAQLGAAVASADLHLAPEHEVLQARMYQQIAFVARLLEEAQIPTLPSAPTPIWFVRVGASAQARALGARMLAAGYFLNLSVFPIVPRGQSGLRFTHTLLHTEEQLRAMITTLAAELRRGAVG